MNESPSSRMVESGAQDLRRVIGLTGGTALIVGITIGSGIFRTPPTIAGLVPHPLAIMALWTAFGLISIPRMMMRFIRRSGATTSPAIMLTATQPS